MFDLSTAVGFFGIHYIENLNHWMGWNTKVDYEACLENNKNYVFKHFKISDYYASTYFSTKVPKLIEDFKFTSIRLNTLVNDRAANLISKNKRFKETIRLILESEKKYDIIILMRFDLMFLHSISDLNISLKKINLICKNKCGNIHDLADDTFYLIPGHQLEPFYTEIDKIDIQKSSHEYNRYFDFHYMINEAFYTHEYPTLRVHRLPVV